ncbi:MAG: hypothetical protein WCJ97_12345, partial [Phycisphaerae bacterium]
MSGTFSGTGLRAVLSVVILLAMCGLALGQSGTEVALSSAASQPSIALTGAPVAAVEQIDTGATAWMLISSA